jgi:hypothetical protein
MPAITAVFPDTTLNSFWSDLLSCLPPTRPRSACVSFAFEVLKAFALGGLADHEVWDAVHYALENPKEEMGEGLACLAVGTQSQEDTWFVTKSPEAGRSFFTC